MWSLLFPRVSSWRAIQPRPFGTAAPKRIYRIKNYEAYCASRRPGAQARQARRAADPDYDTRYREACVRGGHAASLSIATRRASDPEYDTWYKASIAATAKRAADPEYDQRYREVRRLAALASAATITARRASDPEYDEQFRERCRSNLLAAKVSIAARRASDPEYDKQFRERCRANGYASQACIAAKRASDPAYDRQYRETLRTNALASREAVAARRASDPEYDEQYRQGRRAGGHASQAAIAEKRAQDPEYDQWYRGMTGAWGARYAQICAAAELGPTSPEELEKLLRGTYYSNPTRVSVFHYLVAGGNHKDFGPCLKPGIVYNRRLQPSFAWNGTAQLSSDQRSALAASLGRAESQLLLRYRDLDPRRIVVRVLPALTLGAGRLLEDIHLVKLYRRLGKPLGDSLEYFAFQVSEDPLEAVGLSDAPLFEEEEMRSTWASDVVDS